jgi:pyrroloquinoline-quinone synthase
MPSIWNRLETAHRGCDVLEHPFYLRWSRGELEREELAVYAAQYLHAARALADALDDAAEKAPPGYLWPIAEHAWEEHHHVRLWEDFARSVGALVMVPAEPETWEFVAALVDGDRGWMETLVAVYAIESTQAAVAATKRDGLIRFYGINSARALAYFTLHAHRDDEHAAQVRRLVEPRVGSCDESRLVAAAEGAWRGNWTLLDGVERVSGATGAPAR